MKKLLIATSNKGKFNEYIQLLNGLPFELVNLNDAGISASVEENYDTYEENALHKALSCAGMSGLMTLADDSGLEVNALNGEPGVKSARYAGDDADDARRVEYLLSKLKGVPAEKRTARFVCYIAVAVTPENTEVFKGQCEGYITEEPRGGNGFGYDPVFYFSEMRKTMAELPAETKNKISHRAVAAQKAYKMLETLAERAGL